MARMSLLGADASAQPVGEARLPGAVNILVGSDRTKWRTGLPSFARIRYPAVYPDTDLVFYGNQRQLEYDFVVGPKGDPSAIALQFDGGIASVTAEGDLKLSVDGGAILFRKPVLYQDSAAGREPVEGAWQMKGPDRAGFAVASYDRSRPLIIDPVLAYSSFLGGSQNDWGNAIAVDPDGSFYIAGNTCSTDLPTTSGALQASAPADAQQGCSPGSGARLSGFVAKFAALSGLASGADPAAPVYVTYLGASYTTTLSAIAVDSSGNAYVAGQTFSNDYPTTSGALQRHCAATLNCDGTVATQCNGDTSGASSGVVSKLSADGASLVYSTYLGGSGGADTGATTGGFTAIALDSAGEAYLAGWTGAWSSGNVNCPTTQVSWPYPTTSSAYQPSPAWSYTGPPPNNYGWWVFSKLSADGSTLIYSTNLFTKNRADFGGYASFPRGIAVSPVDQSAAIVGRVYALSYPTTKGALQPTQNKTEAQAGTYPGGYIAKIDPSKSGASSLVWSTYFAGSGSACNDASSVATDGAGNIFVAGNNGGWTLGNCSPATDLPTTTGSFQAAFAGSQPCCTSDGWIARFAATGRRVWATYLGGTGGNSSTQINGIAVDKHDDIFVSGCTADFHNPSTYPSVNQIPGGYAAGASATSLVTEFASSGKTLLLSTLLGGGNSDCGSGIALDPTGNPYVVGTAADNGSGMSFPTTPGSFESGCENLGACGNGNPDAFVYTIRQSDVDLGVSDTPSANPTPSGQNLTYTIVVENSGTVTANGVTLNTGVPAGGVFETAVVSAGRCAKPKVGGGGTVSCGGFNLAPGQSVTLALTVRVDATAGAVLGNTVLVRKYGNDYNIINDTIATSVTVD